MKIAVVGCGAVGIFYGARLCLTGAETFFLLRTDYEAVCRDGVRVFSVDGDFAARPRCARQPAEIGPCDLVVIALKTTANAEFPRLLPPLLGPDTRLLTLQNGIGSDDDLARRFGGERVLGGLCFVCLNRVAPGVVRHTAHGKIVLGEYGRPTPARTHTLAERFRQAGIRCDVTTNLAQARWEKLVWNVPFNGLGVAGVVGQAAFATGAVPSGFALPAACLPTDVLLADPGWETCLRALMREIIAAANALGFPLPPALEERNIANTRCMAAYKASTLLDFELGRPLELASIFLEPQRRARGAGVPTPVLDRLCAVLTQLDALRAAGR
jgi:2-dehydropantoate 2-reductase